MGWGGEPSRMVKKKEKERKKEIKGKWENSKKREELRKMKKKGKIKRKKKGKQENSNGTFISKTKKDSGSGGPIPNFCYDFKFNNQLFWSVTTKCTKIF